MDITEQINKFQEFLEANYYDKLLDNVQKGKKFLIVDFAELSKFNPEIAEALLETPEEILKVAELSAKKAVGDEELKDFTVRIKNIPEQHHIRIRNIRSKHLTKFVQVEGIVRQKSDVRPQVTSAKFECPSCGNLINILQIDSKFKEPSRCSCGRKGKFRLISKELVDAQKLVLEEAPEDLTGGEQPKRLNIFLKKDLVSPITEKKTNPGSKLKVVGEIKEVPIILTSGGISTRYDLMIESNYLEPIQEDFSEVEISKKELIEIKKLSHDPNVYEKLVVSIAPTIFGHEKVKEALLLQLMGGSRKVKEEGIITRGDMHVLLIGDPGSGKSQLLKRISQIAPKGRYVSGKGASAAGLTASVVKDEFLRGYALEAGALVLTNRGICCIDELDKMTTEDRSAMHEALEQQTVTISKANIQATLRAETTVLAAANPKFGRFDPYELLAKQINLPSTLINRFDLIFPIRDLPDSTRDEKMAAFILSLHREAESKKSEIDVELMKKYISYARQNIKPRLTTNALNEIKNFYVKMRNTVSSEEGIVAIPISPRQLEGLVRLAEASARTRLSDKVTKKDSQRAIELVHFCLTQIGLDPETGKIDIDRISTGITATERSHIAIIREIINDLEKAIGKTIPVEDVIREAEIKGIDSKKVEEVIEKLKRSGDIFSPRHGLISRI
ncbi:MAG: minichromosome maintenance protein MCM [Nanoarchaeota archaeon]|nr:minichromosome maintenance protein MCM [DPANN group archaeon]MBL7117088.1 minichromosome maintenance protein MCM [Nanoarchaeota archaeon]